MKSNSGYTSVSYFIFRACFIGMSSQCLVNSIYQDSWLGILLGFIIGFIPIYCIYFLASKCNDGNIIDLINNKFIYSKHIIKAILFILVFLLTLLNFCNMTKLIYTQFLNRTPTIVISIMFIIPIIMLINKNNKVLSRVCFILFIIGLLLYLISIFGLINKFNINNIKPILEYNPTKGIIPYISYNVLPIFMILIIPGNQIKKSIIKGYIISSISLFITMFLLLGILGINLTLLFKYPEFHILKYAYEDMINFRLENILSIITILDTFIFTSIGIKYCNESFNIKKKNIIPIIMIVLSIYILDLNYLTYKNIILKLPLIYVIILSAIIFLIIIKSVMKLHLKHNFSN